MSNLKRLSLALLLALTLGVVASVLQAQTATRMWGITSSQLAAGATTGSPLLCTASGSGCILQAVISGALANLQALAFGTGTATATVQGTLTTSTTQVCTTAVVTEEVLWTYDLPANSLDSNGRGVRITVFGITAANANLKTQKLTFGATTIHLRNAQADNASRFRFVAEVLRTGASAQYTAAHAVFGGDFSYTAADSNAQTTPAADTTAAITIAFKSTNGTAAANDSCIKGAIVETLR